MRIVQKNSAFTLIETLVVLTILTVLAGLTVSAFRDYERTQRLATVVADVKNGFAETRTKTLGSVDDTVYGVHVGASSIQFFSGSTPVIGSNNNTIITLPAGISATSSFSNHLAYLTFARLTAIPTATGTVTITDLNTNTTKTFTISAAGLVQ
jgi:prepilin-type N-terminal cleavage/methylation domain-containing protein